MNKNSPAKYYIGLSSGYHDPAIALVDADGKLIFAEATERFIQNKMGLSSAVDNLFFVEKLIRQYPMSDYEIAINWKAFEHLIRFPLLATWVYFLRKYIRIVKWIGRILKFDGDEFASVVNYQVASHYGTLTMAGAAFRFVQNIRYKLPYKTLNHFDHHLCHATYGYFTSPFREAIIFVLDGGGDNGKSCSVYKANEQSIKEVFRNRSRASLGDYYGYMTYLCGFNLIGGEEWKVMGMAPYGKKNDELYNDLKEWIYVSGFHLEPKNARKVFQIRNKIKENKYHGLTRYDIAFTAQLYYETLVTQMLNAIHLKWPGQNLILVGGCALNSAFNGKIHTSTPFKNVYIPSAPADDGCSAGAAFLNFKKHNPFKQIPYNQTDPYLGFNIGEEDILKMANYSGHSVTIMEYKDLYPYIAKELQSGKIVAWTQGKAEFGPRALGNRSILANPSLGEMKDKINATIKYREEFRPFAPAILEEQAPDYFEYYHPTPYMERVLKIKENKRSELKAVNHIDNTGRLQTVTKTGNLHFYNLINEFYKLTNVPVLLNTSFNVMGKPIVDSVSDMAAVFSTSGIDILVINKYVFQKRPPANKV